MPPLEAVRSFLQGERTTIVLLLVVFAVSLALLLAMPSLSTFGSERVNHWSAQEKDGFLGICTGDSAVLVGRVVNVTPSESVTRMQIAVIGPPVDVVDFSKQPFSLGDLVRIEGRVQDYRGEKELIADRVEIKKTE